MRRLLLFLLLLLLPSICLAADPIVLRGDNLTVKTDNNGSMTLETKGTGHLKIIVHQDGDAHTIEVDDTAGNITFPGTLIGTGTATLGWTVQAGADTACSTTCTTPCVFGVNTAATEADIVDCADATADECLCAGAS